MSAPVLVRFDDVGLHSPGHEEPLLQGLTFSLDEGAALTLTGAAGNGKSTALAMVVGGATPTAGEVRVLGERPARLTPEGLDGLRARIGYVPQRGGLLSNLSLLDNVALPLRYHRSAGDDEVRAGLARVQEALGIEPLPALPAALAPLKLRLLAAVARALILQPRVLILDEPARDLAGLAEQDLWRLLAGLRERLGIAILAATGNAESAYLLGGSVIALPARRRAQQGSHASEGATATTIWRGGL